MRTILLPFHDDEASQIAAETSFQFAHRFNSFIEGLFVHRPPQIIAGEGITIPADYVTQLADDGRAHAVNARERFDRTMQAHGVPYAAVDEPADAVTAGWREVEGLEGEIVGQYGRLFDIIALGRTSQPATADWNVMCEAALFDSGIPVLLCPAAPPEHIGSNIVIIWNGSSETARCIAPAMPLLARAEAVTVLGIDGWGVPGPSTEQVATHLYRNGIVTAAKVVAQDSRAVGEIMLEEADKLGADLIVKGAYTQSRLRQMIFGGATRHILTHATLPVFMAH